MDMKPARTSVVKQGIREESNPAPKGSVKAKMARRRYAGNRIFLILRFLYSESTCKLLTKIFSYYKIAQQKS